MTPSARLQAAIELLDAIIASARDNGAAADTLIARYFKERRYAGSKDRRAVRELVYQAIRAFPERPVSGRAAMIGLGTAPALFDRSPHGPAPVDPSEPVASPGEMPGWLRGAFAPELDEADIASLTGRAPLDLRVNRTHATREAVLARLGEGEPGPAPRAIRLPEGWPVEQHPVWAEGLVDVQDAGSQLVADSCYVKPGATVIDLCAGAGGKTLALWDAVGGNARIVACDTDRGRLSRLLSRAERCRMQGIETRLLDPGREAAGLADLAGTADCVLVDAPCSGTGTWRRNPEARWRLTPARVERYAAQQRTILATAADLVAPGGTLLYAVCSLLAAEGKDQISAFLASRSDFRKLDADMPVGLASGDGFLLTPARHRTDGFFFARMGRAC